MSDLPNLPEAVKLVNTGAHGTFWPEGNWYFVRDLAVPLIWSPKDGWRKYYEVNREDCHFSSEQEAMKAWENSMGPEEVMNDPNEEQCGKCGAEIDRSRRVDFTLKDGTRVCESCFVKGTERVAQKRHDWSN